MQKGRREEWIKRKKGSNSRRGAQKEREARGERRNDEGQDSATELWERKRRGITRRSEHKEIKRKKKKKTERLRRKREEMK